MFNLQGPAKVLTVCSHGRDIFFKDGEGMTQHINGGMTRSTHSNTNQEKNS